ncbi:MAG: hypothetical protein GPOALKHO_000229 [Sodalis sp.]|nr:MAG: hypothetical protein GPOALKHO_000229 [Sodalis sp.]
MRHDSCSLRRTYSIAASLMPLSVSVTKMRIRSCSALMAVTTALLPYPMAFVNG